MPEAGSDWTESEVDLIVADYFDKLTMELRGEPFVKARRNATLQEMTGRSRGSIEFKRQNISAVLLHICLPWIAGYKPMANFQGALITGIERYLTAHPALFTGSETEAQAAGFAEDSPLFFEAPPVPSFEPTPPLLRKFDPALRDARNRALGRRGEERIFYHEQTSLRDAGRADLARKVRWVSEEDGDGAGYDIRSFDPAGRERLIEVKATIGTVTTPFFLPEIERGFAEERPATFRLARPYDLARQPRAFELVPPLDSHVTLRPANWRAKF